jgi:hypothetical protein
VLLVACLAAAVARAESLYVIEQLVVNVNSTPDGSGERVATVKSGDRLEVLERAGDQVHVRLANGRDGWVRASYLSADEPLRARLAQRDAEVAQLKDQLGRLQAEQAAARAAGTGPGSGAATSPGAGSTGGSPAGAPPAAAAPGEDPGGPAAGALFAVPGEERPHRVWPWALGAALAGLGVGFAAGALVLDRYIRRQYGGLRIY